MAHVADHLGCIWGFGLQQPSRQHTRHRHCCSTKLLPPLTPEPKEKKGKGREVKDKEIIGFRKPWDAKSVRNNKLKQGVEIVGEDAAQPKELVRRCFECALHNWLAMQQKGDVRVLGAYTHYKWASCREPPWELWNIPDASVTALWFPESPFDLYVKQRPEWRVLLLFFEKSFPKHWCSPFIRINITAQTRTQNPNWFGWTNPYTRSLLDA